MVIAILLIMMILCGTAEAGIGMLASLAVRSPLSSFILKPLTTASMIVAPGVMKSMKVKRIAQSGGAAAKTGSFIKDNAKGLATGLVISGLWHRPEKSVNVSRSFYSIIPMPVKIILFLIIAGYLSPYISNSWSRLENSFKRNGKNNYRDNN